jgi:hypothetical protein
LELFLQRLHMIAVNMCVPDNMDKITWNKVWQEKDIIEVD